MSFGERLREQRERQQISLDDIVERTKIRKPLLESLEQGDVSHWPGGIFRRSYFKSYAAAIGLDVEPAVQEFLAVHAAAIDEPVAETDAPEEEGRPRKPRLRLHYLIESAIGALPLFHSTSKGDRRRTTDTPAPQTPPVEARGDEVPVETGSQPVIPELESAIAEVAAAQASDVEPPPATHVEHGRETAQQASAVDLSDLARLCTRIARARGVDDVTSALADAARLLDAHGLILWLCSHDDRRLWPSLSHGYSPEILAQLPPVPHDANNAIAAAFRLAAAQVVDDGDASDGAVVVPILTPDGCSGVLAFECASTRARDETTIALAAILAAQLSLLTDAVPMSHVAIA